MYMVGDKGGAIALMIAALCLLGTWPAILNSLERRGRLLQHTYLDYSITNFLGAVVIALTFGQMGSERPNFLTQVGEFRDNYPSVGFALAGGLVLSMGNLAIQYGWPFVGLAAAGVVSSSIAVVGGTTVNYFLDGGINRAEILFPGVACFLVAVFLGSLLHVSNSADTKAKLRIGRGDEVSDSLMDFMPKDVEKSLPIPEDKGVMLFSIKDDIFKSESGTAEYFKELDEKRAVKSGSAGYIFGLSIVFFAGFCFAIFSPAFNLATNDQWHTLESGVENLVVYTAFFYFSIAAVLFGVISNIYFLYYPLLGLPRSSFSAYLQDWDGRLWALLAGVVCSIGNGFQFMGGQAAGYAAADAVQALPLVSTFWGILIFKEYHRSSRRTYVSLVSMIIMFIAAVVFLASSAEQRQS